MKKRRRYNLPRYHEKKRVSPLLPGSLIDIQDPASWGEDKEFLPDPTTVDWNLEYTPIQLERIADAMLWRDIEGGRRNYHDPVILMHEHIHERRRREIYVKAGIPDPTVACQLSPDNQMMYWRTRPNGRKVNTDEQRVKNGASFYR